MVSFLLTTGLASIWNIVKLLTIYLVFRRNRINNGCLLRASLTWQHFQFSVTVGAQGLYDKKYFYNSSWEQNTLRRPITYQLYRTNVYLLNLLILMTSDSDIEDDPVPEPSTDSPVVVHFGATGGCISYFGFVNIVDVSLFGAIMLRLVNAAHQKIKKKTI